MIASFGTRRRRQRQLVAQLLVSRHVTSSVKSRRAPRWAEPSLLHERIARFSRFSRFRRSRSFFIYYAIIVNEYTEYESLDSA